MKICLKTTYDDTKSILLLFIEFSFNKLRMDKQFSDRGRDKDSDVLHHIAWPFHLCMMSDPTARTPIDSGGWDRGYHLPPRNT